MHETNATLNLLQGVAQRSQQQYRTWKKCTNALIKFLHLLSPDQPVNAWRMIHNGLEFFFLA